MNWKSKMASLVMDCLNDGMEQDIKYQFVVKDNFNIEVYRKGELILQTEAAIHLEYHWKQVALQTINIIINNRFNDLSKSL